VTDKLSTVVAGVTGGVGAGKSLAESLCRSWGIPTADADRWAHAVLNDDPDVRAAVETQFQQRYGQCPLTADGRLDRAAIAAHAFADASVLRFLEGLIHPRVRRMAGEWIETQRAQAVPLAVLVVPLLIESGMTAQVDCVIVIAASAATRAARLAAGRGWSSEECARRMAAQMDENERRRQADYIVANEGSQIEFAEALYAVVREIQRAAC
jgi:dephospho-CoA kinase